MWETIAKLGSAIFAALLSFLTIRKKKVDLKNAEDMKKRKKAQDEIKKRNEAEELVGDAASEDPVVKEKALDEIRKRISK